MYILYIRPTIFIVVAFVRVPASDLHTDAATGSGISTSSDGGGFGLQLLIRKLLHVASGYCSGCWCTPMPPRSSPPPSPSSCSSCAVAAAATVFQSCIARQCYNTIRRADYKRWVASCMYIQYNRIVATHIVWASLARSRRRVVTYWKRLAWRMWHWQRVRSLAHSRYT